MKTKYYHKTIRKLKKQVRIPLRDLSFYEWKLYLKGIVGKFDIQPSISIVSTPIDVKMGIKYDIEKIKAEFRTLHGLAIQGMVDVLTPHIPVDYKLEIKWI